MRNTPVGDHFQREDSTNQHVKNLIESIKNMKVENFATYNDSKLHVINERSFAYELYHRWVENKDNNLVINAEITKKIEDKFQQKVEDLFGEEKFHFEPDLVLHNSNADSDDQALICEIKLHKYLTPKSVSKDIQKLIAYTTPDMVLYHPFKWGVFICVLNQDEDFSKNLSFIQDHLKNYPNNKLSVIKVTIKNNTEIEAVELLYP